MGGRESVLSACGRAVYAQASLRGWHFRSSLPHQAEDSLTVGSEGPTEKHPLQSGGRRFVLWRGRRFQKEPQRAWSGLRCGLEALPRLVAPSRRDRFAVGGGGGGWPSL